VKSLRVAIVVHGRFHAFDLTRELLALGHNVQLFTNYPAYIAVRFGIPRKRVHSFLLHGIASRLAQKVLPGRCSGALEKHFNILFGRWAKTELVREKWDVVHSFSGISEEIFNGLRDRPDLRVLARGSTHIATQRQLLDEEELRAGVRVDKPSDWIVEREQREYELADRIFVLGDFAWRTFLDRGFPSWRLFQLRSGVQTRSFSALPETIADRERRILNGEPLCVLNVGTFCLRKGALDWVEIIRKLDPRCFRVRFVGPVSSDARHLMQAIHDKAEFCGKKPQAQLPGEYSRGDLFLLPTIEEGFAGVIPQALAGGMPIITTPNSGAGTLIEEGRNGWMLPPRRPDLFLRQLDWCNAHRAELATMVKLAHQSSTAWDWSEMARQAEGHFRDALAQKRAKSMEKCSRG
jgi:colanic acid/amylovoran biosynthesis glycosyltransferase